MVMESSTLIWHTGPYTNLNMTLVVADLGFSLGGGAKSEGECEKALFGQFFPEAAWNLNEFLVCLKLKGTYALNS